jgi:hypothetical protein
LTFELPTTASVPATASYFLNLRIANAEKLKKTQRLEIHQVSRSWDEGSGYFYQTVANVNDGATWNQSATNISWSLAGGDTLNATTASVTLNTYPIQDIRVDVTSLIQPYVSQSVQSTFNGLLLKFPDADEIDSDNEGILKVFSSQTHTVHLPTLEIAWASQAYVTGSTLTKIPSMDVQIVPTNVREEYRLGEVSRINFTIRDQYPLKAFDATLRYANKYYLPTSSYYSIVDARTQIEIVPFDTYSALNCDALGMYMSLDTTPLYKGRFYTLKLKIESGSYTRILDTNTLFKIV